MGLTKARIRTMEEFSAVSGISRPTLSRFFNDPESVRPASRARIEEAVKRYGYRPNLFAVNFNRRNPKTIGIVVPSLLDPFYAGIVECIERRARAAGYWTVIQNSHGTPEREAEAVATLLSLKVAGTIAVPLGDASRRSLYRNAAKAMPMVFVDTIVEVDAAFVGTDNRQSIGLMVDYLLRSGSPPTYFDMPDLNQNARERRQAYAAAMAASGLEPRFIPVAEPTWEFERAGYEEALRSLDGAAGQTILCANDRIAFGVMAAASRKHIPIGRDGALRIAGHDDHPLSRYACPSLTTVAQDGEQLASMSLESLLQAVGEETGAPTRRQIPARLIMRDSA